MTPDLLEYLIHFIKGKLIKTGKYDHCVCLENLCFF